MTLQDIIGESFLTKYRELLDAEDQAFDNLEHCCEDGDRSHFEVCLGDWREAFDRKLIFLHKHGIVASPSLTD